MRKKLADEGLLRRYNTDPDFALVARMIVALSFVPIEDLDVALEALENEIMEDLTPILNWFEDVYRGRQNRNRTRRRALFPPHMWSVYERTLNGENRTNNYVEAAHRRLQAEFGMDHPNIWKFIDGIRAVQNAVTHYISNSFVETSRLSSAENTLQQISESGQLLRVTENIMEEFLRGITHNVLMEP